MAEAAHPYAFLGGANTRCCVWLGVPSRSWVGACPLPSRIGLCCGPRYVLQAARRGECQKLLRPRRGACVDPGSRNRHQKHRRAGVCSATSTQIRKRKHGLFVSSAPTFVYNTVQALFPSKNKRQTIDHKPLTRSRVVVGFGVLQCFSRGAEQKRGGWLRLWQGSGNSRQLYSALLCGDSLSSLSSETGCK